MYLNIFVSKYFFFCDGSQDANKNHLELISLSYYYPGS